MELYDIIKEPCVSEKGTELGKQNKHLFLVDKNSNKLQIKSAIEKIFKVKVASVNIIRLKGKKRRVRYKEGMTPEKKKAIITLKEGHKIELV
jgi:large subunit ribosomal protein L23